eukprot:scaffold152460_cov15-Tisochrysis_lutea.AAC.1
MQKCALVLTLEAPFKVTWLLPSSCTLFDGGMLCPHLGQLLTLTRADATLPINIATRYWSCTVGCSLAAWCGSGPKKCACFLSFYLPPFGV